MTALFVMIARKWRWKMGRKWNGLLKQISARRYVMLILSIVLIPMAVFFIMYNTFLIKAVQVVNQQAAQTGQQTMELYVSLMEAELNALGYMILEDWANDEKFQPLAIENNYITVTYRIRQIRDAYLMTMINSNWFSAMSIVSNPNDFTYTFFKDGIYENEEMIAIRQSVHEIVDTMKENPTGTWFLQEIEHRKFLCSIVGTKQAYSILFMDLQELCNYQMEQLNETGVILYYTTKDGLLLVEENEIDQEHTLEKDLSQGYYITETVEGETYLAVGEFLEPYGVWFLYFSPWTMGITLLESYLWIFHLFAVVMILMVPMIYFLLIHKIVVPIEQLTQIMRDIRDNKERKKVEKPAFLISELKVASVTFYEMLEQINKLKIESYEKESIIQKVELQCMQLQLKPHFFFNCLKLIYSMLELKKYEQVQPLVLQTSKYLRYCLREQTSLIPLKEELENVSIYIELLRNSTMNAIELNLKIEEGLEEYLIPNLVIQSFVENSCKYAAVPNQTLELVIQIIKLEAEEGVYLDIVVRDNGKGYPSSIIEYFQTNQLQWRGNENIGINNIVQRLLLLYEGKAQIQLSNCRGGAHSELIIPMKEDFK